VFIRKLEYAKKSFILKNILPSAKKIQHEHNRLQQRHIRYDTIAEFNVDSKAEYTA